MTHAPCMVGILGMRQKPYNVGYMRMTQRPYLVDIFLVQQELCEVSTVRMQHPVIGIL